MTQTAAEAILLNLVHDLRQPLSTMEAIAYFLDHRMQHNESIEAREYLSQMQRLVSDANSCLSSAVMALASSRAA